MLSNEMMTEFDSHSLQLVYSTHISGPMPDSFLKGRKYLRVSNSLNNLMY